MEDPFFYVARTLACRILLASPPPHGSRGLLAARFIHTQGLPVSHRKNKSLLLHWQTQPTKAHWTIRVPSFSFCLILTHVCFLWSWVMQPLGPYVAQHLVDFGSTQASVSSGRRSLRLIFPLPQNIVLETHAAIK